ncbi:hypothetical protein VP1G_06832 [Cytospora mali]|uniref:Pentatricopeptide repeat protein n=1 Tax=Cytospora mali TaxID=578113 RepID=A0A194V6R9_CYTMA|nr:hypothetical protein VP1G_06832 [Valsa mali var. pyri (nom. inval.)]
MQYVCRSCLLRLGQPWRLPARQRQLGQFLSQPTRRAIQSLEVPTDRGSREPYDGRVHSNSDPPSATDSKYSAKGPVKSTNDRGPEEPTAPVWSPDLGFRKVALSFRKCELEPEWMLFDRTWPPKEDTQAVEVDEAFDDEAQEEHGDVSEEDGVSTASEFPDLQQSGADNTKQTPVNHPSWEHDVIPGLNRRDKNQFSFLRSEGRGRDIKLAIDNFNSWKRNLSNLSDPQRAEPSHMEIKVLNWLLIHESVESMRAVLQSSIPGRTKKERSRLLLYVALRFVPERAPMVLEALMADIVLPSYMIEDTIQLLVIHIRKLNLDEQQVLAGTLTDLVAHIFEQSPQQYIQFSQNTLFSLMHVLPAKKLAVWFDKLVEIKHPLHAYTMLHFASRFAKSPETKVLSLDILRDLCDGKLDINTAVGASLCSSILTFEENELLALDENQATPAELFQCLLELGLVPNVITYTAIMRDLCLKKELATALDVFKVMRQHGIEPDAYTYSVIINGCKSCEDFDTLVHFAVEARTSNIQDPHVWNDIIHATFLACLKEPREKGGPRRPRYMVWGPMNAIYTRFFDSQPLRPLIAAQLTEVHSWMELQGYIPTKLKGAFVQLRPLPPLQHWQPTSSTLALMIMGFVRHLPRPYDVIVFYSHFRDLLRQGHPTAELLVREQGSLVHDIVLRALLKWRGTLRVMLDIIRDMMRDIDQIAAGTSPSPSVTPIAQPAKEFAQSLKAEAPPTDAMPLVAEAEVPFNDSEGDALDKETAHPEASMSDAEANAADAAGAEPEHTGPPIRHPRPSVYTWSILLKAFMFNHLPGQAEQVIKLMQHHGISPNLVTWNTLAASYAKLGKTRQAVEAMRRLEAAGFKSDDWTLRAFSYIHNKGAAIKLMEQTVEQNRLTKMATEQAQAEAEEKRLREQQQLIEDEMRERQFRQEQLPQDETRHLREESGGLADDVSREVYEEVVKIMGKADGVEKPDLNAWDMALWDESELDESQDAETSEYDELRQSRRSNA